MGRQAEEVEQFFGCSVIGGKTRGLVAAVNRKRMRGLTAEGTTAPANVEELTGENDGEYHEDHYQSSGEVTHTHILLCVCVCVLVLGVELISLRLVGGRQLKVRGIMGLRARGLNVYRKS